LPQRRGCWTRRGGFETRPYMSSSQLATDIVAVEPPALKRRLVTTEGLAKGKFHVPLEPRPVRDEMVLTRPCARAQHGSLCTRRPCLLVNEQCCVEVLGVTRDRGCQHAGVFDRHGRALTEIRQHGVRGITEQGCPSFAPSSS